MACSSPATTGGVATTPAAAATCEAASPQLIAAISTGLKIQGGGSLRAGQAAKSTALEKVWMVSADLEGPGLTAKDNLATWATNVLAGGGSIFSVDAFAREFSQWGSGPGFALSDPGVAESRACVTAALR